MLRHFHGLFVRSDNVGQDKGHTVPMDGASHSGQQLHYFGKHASTPPSFQWQWKPAARPAGIYAADYKKPHKSSLPIRQGAEGEVDLVFVVFCCVCAVHSLCQLGIFHCVACWVKVARGKPAVVGSFHPFIALACQISGMKWCPHTLQTVYFPVLQQIYFYYWAFS